MKSHDQNFKNLFLDFPEEALEWILPEALESCGKILKIEFPRQEPKKWNLSDAHLALDMPILFIFENRQLVLWLVEFQEDKAGFSVYRLLRYLTDLMEAYPDATVIPAVLFTDRRKWRKDVVRSLVNELNGRKFLYFQYILVKLFDFNASDYYESQNPIVRILLPKMNYGSGERNEVIRRAYQGLFELTTLMLFDKYVDFIDIYAEVTELEREDIYREIIEHKETAMLAQYIRNKGFEEGIQRGMQQGMQQGEVKGVEQNLRDTVQKMYRKGIHVVQIADILEIEARQVESYLNEA